MSTAILLIWIDSKYPFFPEVGGPWSVGFSTSNSIKDFKVEEKNIISYSYIDSLLEERIFYIADPFFLKSEGRWYVFVELKGEDNANIALLTSENGIEFQYNGVVLDEDFHLSYPQVFKHEKEFYMLPETKGANQVLLYKAQNFPFDWIIHDTLIQNRSVKDPTILLSEEINLIVAAGDDLKQYMFRADSLDGEWTEVVNYRQRQGNETRPGGRFFKNDGNWYIPLQNRSGGYGTGVSLYKLNHEEDFISLEKDISMFLGPQKIKWFNRGMHHLDMQSYEGKFFFFYDGDESLNNKRKFQYKKTLKLVYYDLLNLFKR